MFAAKRVCCNAASTAAATTAAAAAATAALAAVAPPSPVFTLKPALANTAPCLDLTSLSGAKHLKGTIQALNSQPFDFADYSDLQVFLDLVLTKSQIWGWNHIFTPGACRLQAAQLWPQPSTRKTETLIRKKTKRRTT
jgi:hypothetical protein